MDYVPNPGYTHPSLLEALYPVHSPLVLSIWFAGLVLNLTYLAPTYADWIGRTSIKLKLKVSLVQFLIISGEKAVLFHNITVRVN